jgi:hypothetical protein
MHRTICDGVSFIEITTVQYLTESMKDSCFLSLKQQ